MRIEKDDICDTLAKVGVISITVCVILILVITLFLLFKSIFKSTNFIPTKTIYQDQTVCYSIGFDGWQRVTKSNRLAISELVASGRARIIEAQTLTCYDYSKTPLQELILREQWWKRGK